MKNIEDINKAAIQKITANKKITEFSPGDTIKVGVKIVEGKRERIQYFEGVCIAKKNRDLNSSFTVRKISFGEGVERTFPLYGTLIDSIKVIRSGKVRRAKLYYLRDLTGKKARIVERMRSKQPDLASLFISENDEVLEEEYLTEEASSEESNDENSEANVAETEKSDLEETTQEEKTEDKAEELKD